MLHNVLLVTLHFIKLIYAVTGNTVDSNVIKKEDLVYWPNASIPFYIDPEHYDHEQSLSIMTSLSVFSFKTCLKFNPVLVKPTTSQHVMVFENPNGVRKCIFNTAGHITNEPHRITLGYACLKSPQLEMMVMRALGFGFEHNRASRDIYIDVQLENIDSGPALALSGTGCEGNCALTLKYKDIWKANIFVQTYKKYVDETVNIIIGTFSGKYYINCQV